MRNVIMKSQLFVYSTSTERKSRIAKGLFEVIMLHWQICLVITVLIFPLAQYACKNPVNKKKGEVNIIDLRRTQEPNVNLASHKPRDIEVYRISFLDSSCYSVIYYQKENDSIKSHKAYYAINEDFDKVFYNWINDTTLSVKLFNTRSKNEKAFKVFGNGRSSGISFDK